MSCLFSRRGLAISVISARRARVVKWTGSSEMDETPNGPRASVLADLAVARPGKGWGFAGGENGRDRYASAAASGLEKIGSALGVSEARSRSLASLKGKGVRP